MTQLGAGLRWGLGLLVALGLLGMPSAARGQDDSTARAAGTAVEFVLALNSFAFQSAQGEQVGSNGMYRACGCVLFAPVTLPSGALLTGIELDALDAFTSGEVVASLRQCPVGSQGCNPLVTASTGIAAAPGVTQVRSDLAFLFTVDNRVDTYVIQVDGTTAGPSLTALTGVRVFYRLQVSPAPTVATFSDVPTSHPFFRFIEALAASGITAGCGGGNFCPDAPLTRGQMAVFLSHGLGLHFAP
jgi:S-layer family protein